MDRHWRDIPSAYPFSWRWSFDLQQLVLELRKLSSIIVTDYLEIGAHF
jgi:hypothetical protein